MNQFRNQYFILFIFVKLFSIYDGGSNRVVVGFTTTYKCMQSMPITTVVVGLTPDLCSFVQHHVIKFVSDLRQVGGFLQFPQPIKLTATI